MFGSTPFQVVQVASVWPWSYWCNLDNGHTDATWTTWKGA